MEKREEPTDSTKHHALATPFVKKEKLKEPTDSGSCASGSTKWLARESMGSAGGEVKIPSRKKAKKMKKLDQPILQPTRRSSRILKKKESSYLPAFDGPSTSKATGPQVRDETK